MPHNSIISYRRHLIHVRHYALFDFEDPMKVAPVEASYAGILPTRSYRCNARRPPTPLWRFGPSALPGSGHAIFKSMLQRSKLLWLRLRGVKVQGLAFTN